MTDPTITRPIGDKFTTPDGCTAVVTESTNFIDNCFGCIWLANMLCRTSDKVAASGHCSRAWRSDNKSVIFKKVEE